MPPVPPTWPSTPQLPSPSSLTRSPIMPSEEPPSHVASVAVLASQPRSKGLPCPLPQGAAAAGGASSATTTTLRASTARSEEHTSELQSQFHLVCRLLLE